MVFTFLAFRIVLTHADGIRRREDRGRHLQRPASIVSGSASIVFACVGEAKIFRQFVQQAHKRLQTH